MCQYPDGSRYFDDLISVICFITSKAGRLTTGANFLLKQKSGIVQAYFDDGMLTAFHKHNYTELAYVAEGELRQNICGKDEVFKKGEICLIGKDSIHADYLSKQKAAVVFLGIANAFFDKSMKIDVLGGDTWGFSRENSAGRKEEWYRFIRFIPRAAKTETQSIFGLILGEMWNSRPGSRHLIIGYVERLLNLLPVEYRCISVKNEKPSRRKTLFKDIQNYLNLHYKDISISQLCAIFDYNPDYFNRLIRKYTGMTYSKFLQHIRLEKAGYLLKTTGYPVEDISRQIGYENLGYFYRIFYEKYRTTPKSFRKCEGQGNPLSAPPYRIGIGKCYFRHFTDSEIVLRCRRVNHIYLYTLGGMLWKIV
jgi:AraC-like DNA-binding protein/quercetin dioxygenase-like cupin family protein